MVCFRVGHNLHRPLCQGFIDEVHFILLYPSLCSWIFFTTLLSLVGKIMILSFGQLVWVVVSINVHREMVLHSALCGQREFCGSIMWAHCRFRRVL